jgi:hypothetical protein
MEKKREDGTNGNNGTNGKSFLSVFSVFSLRCRLNVTHKIPGGQKHIIPLLIACLVLCVALVRADELHLKDGRVIEAEEIWQVGDAVWYRQGKVIASVPKADVVRITKPKPVVETNAGSPPEPSTADVKTKPRFASPAEARKNESSDEETITRKVSRILLKDGTQIDADSVWEDAERVSYRLGKMQAFVDRAEVKNVLRDFPVSEQKPPSDLKLRFSTGHRGLDQLIVYRAAKHQIDPLLIYLVMREESGFNYRAVSRVGARGLMQLMPGTAQRLGVRNIHDPMQNVEAGTRYLRSLLEMFNGDVNLALAAYNAGEGAVMRYGRRIPPYPETMNYVWRINAAYRRAVAGTQ